ncbi:MAG TPA: 30S ribosomal protein S5 [Candidatus Paceibacterota bacterium]|jgi:small subunit ribosomal protein S5|nr:30S ribosomal protein S5 [Candidatus Paceibacterota bacterium]
MAETQVKPNTDRKPGARGPRRDGGKTFADRVKDVDQKILDIRRVTRVVAGGRRMSFAVSMIIGDKKGVVGLGTGKGNDTALAIAKALKDAKKNAIKIKMTDKHSIPYDVSAKYTSSKVMLFPNHGKGLVAGAAIRDIAIIAGLKDLSAKVVSGSKNKLNTARATMKALSSVSTKYVFGGPKAEVVEVAPVPEAVTLAQE